MQKGKLYSLVESAVTSLGFELWGCELLSYEHSNTLRVYLDDKNGITLDACAEVSRQISALLDVEDPISGAYQLEVSSPGMDRPLFTQEQFARYVGQVIKCRLRRAQDGQRNFKGVVESVTEGHIQLNVEGTSKTITIDNIDKANLVPQF